MEVNVNFVLKEDTRKICVNNSAKSVSRTNKVAGDEQGGVS